VSLEFRCNLGDLIKRSKISQTICWREAGLNKATVSRLVASNSIERIDRDSTAKLMTYFGCNFEELWTIRAIAHNPDGFHEATG
jgi:hypothetical protein